MPLKRLMELRIAARAEELAGVRSATDRVLNRLGYGRRSRHLLVLAVNEACMNVIQHAYKGNPEGEMILEILNNNLGMEFRLTDFAETVNTDRIKPRALEEIRPGGLGTYFMREIMDECVFSVPEVGSGNVLIMKKYHNKTSGARRNAM